jgi:hypothetical protein
VSRRFEPSLPPEDEYRTAVLALLAHYRGARERAQVEGKIVSIAVPDPVLGLRDGRRTLHAPLTLVRYALDDHLGRRVAAIKRRLHDRAIDTGTIDEDLVARCDHLESSLRPVPYRRLTALMLVTVPAVALGLISLLRGEERVRSSLLEQLDDASSLVSDLSKQLLTLDITDVPTVLDEIADRPVKTIVFVVLMILLAVYLTLRPLVSSFRVKRALLCADGGPDFRTAADGAYRLESQVIGPWARETPLDLIVFALPMLLPLYIGLYIVASALAGGFTAAKLVAGLIAAAPPAARLVQLQRTAMRRRSAARAPAPARPVTAPEAAPELRVPERPLTPS